MDAGSGEPLQEVRAALVEPDTKRVYARFAGTRYFGPRRPRTGDWLYAYARGYVIAAHALREGERRVGFPLTRGERVSTIRFVAPEDEAARLAPSIRARVVVSTAGSWPLPETEDLQRGGRTPIEDQWEQPIANAPLQVRWGAGATVRVSVEAGDRIVWPLYAYLRDGTESVFHLESGRIVPVERPAPGGPRLEALEVVIDQLWQPDFAPERIDAWRWHLNGPDWFEQALRSAAPAISITPDVPFHVLARIDGRPLQLHVDRSTTRIDLSRPDGIGILPDRPRIDGEPAPGGALLAAGRLDRLTICEFEALSRRVPGFVHELPPPEAEWRTLRLPAGDWLTLFDRTRGLAHIRWGAQVPPSGAFAEGTLVIRPPAGYRASGSVMVFPVWKGAGGVRTSPPRARRLLHAWPARGDLVVRGLLGGSYGLDVDLDYVQVETGRQIRAPRFAAVDVLGDPPIGEVTLALPPR